MLIEMLKATLTLMVDASRERTPCWTGVAPKPHGNVTQTQWVDGAWLGSSSTLEALQWTVPAIPASRWTGDPTLSTGVGSWISATLHQRGLGSAGGPIGGGNVVAADVGTTGDGAESVVAAVTGGTVEATPMSCWVQAAAPIASANASTIPPRRVEPIRATSMRPQSAPPAYDKSGNAGTRRDPGGDPVPPGSPLRGSEQ